MIGADFATRINLAILFLMSLAPTDIALFLARALGALKCRWIAFRHRREFGLLVIYMSSRLHVSEDQALASLRQCFELITLQDLEGWLLPRITKDSVDRFVRFEGLEYLNAALLQRRGALLFTGHTMSMVCMLVGLRLLGYSLTAVRAGRKDGPTRSMSEWFIRRQFQVMERLGIQVLYSSSGEPFTATRGINALKRNEIVVVLIDTTVRRQSYVEVDFINEVTRMSPGSAMLAMASRAPMLPFWSRRTDMNLPVVGTVGPPIPMERDVKSVVQQQARCLECEILRQPASWRRWLGQLRGIQRNPGVEL